MSRSWPLKRRLIPPAFGLAVALGTAAPIWSGRFSGREADRWTVLFVVLIFAFLLVLFAWMRSTMLGERRHRLTIFGTALVDFFAALVVLATAFALVFGLLFGYLTAHQAQPEWVRLANRVALAGSGALALATGTAVMWEMRKAGSGLAVHHESEDERR